MKKQLLIDFKNATGVSFSEENLDCRERTIIGHASALVDAWEKETKGVHKLDSYNAVLLDEIVDIKVQ